MRRKSAKGRRTQACGGSSGPGCGPRCPHTHSRSMPDRSFFGDQGRPSRLGQHAIRNQEAGLPLSNPRAPGNLPGDFSLSSSRQRQVVSKNAGMDSVTTHLFSEPLMSDRYECITDKQWVQFSPFPEAVAQETCSRESFLRHSIDVLGTSIP